MQNFSERDLHEIASNPNTSLNILKKLVGWRHPDDDGDYPRIDITKEVINNPRMTASCLEEILDILIDSNWDEFFVEFSKLSKLSFKIVEKISKKKFYSGLIIEHLLSQNSPIILDNIAHNSSEESVFIKILKNPVTLTSTIEYLATSSSRAVRNTLIDHPNVSQKALDIVLFMQNKPGTPIEILHELAEDSRVSIKRLLTKYPYTPLNILEKIANSRYYDDCTLKNEDTLDYWDISNNLAIHPNTSLEILNKILEKRYQITFINGRKVDDSDFLVRTIKNRINGQCYVVPKMIIYQTESEIIGDRYNRDNLYQPTLEDEIPF